jgi:hypothetical protein
MIISKQASNAIFFSSSVTKRRTDGWVNLLLLLLFIEVSMTSSLCFFSFVGLGWALRSLKPVRIAREILMG